MPTLSEPFYSDLQTIVFTVQKLPATRSQSIFVYFSSQRLPATRSQDSWISNGSGVRHCLQTIVFTVQNPPATRSQGVFVHFFVPRGVGSLSTGGGHREDTTEHFPWFAKPQSVVLWIVKNGRLIRRICDGRLRLTKIA